MKIQASILFIFFISNLLLAQTGPSKHHALFPLNCKDCHFCEKPTYAKPCLHLCPDLNRGVSVHHSADEAPAVMILDTLSNLYAPSIFTHKLHAEMSDMSGGCEYCHHFNPPGKILTCAECHEASMLRDDISKPGLKGAYHQQCLDCHRSWSHTTDCIICHERKKEGQDIKQLLDLKTEMIKKSHSAVKVPKKIVKETEYEDGPLVTFFHNEHVKLFGIECADCHKDERCGRCHDQTGLAVTEEAEPHDNCIACHSKSIDDKCEKCHGTREKSGFNHSKTGWPLKRYHQEVACTDCHDDDGPVTKLNRSCAGCHGQWDESNFNHDVTGLILDETHIENSCEDCHLNSNFSRKPVCTECHDDISYPKFKPGKIK